MQLSSLCGLTDLEVNLKSKSNQKIKILNVFDDFS